MLSSPYTLKDFIGEGGNACVFTATKPQCSKVFAIKVVMKVKLDSNERKKKVLIREIDLMRKLDHPRILKLHEVIHLEDSIHLVLDLAEGGDLLKRVIAKGKFPESQVKEFMVGLLEVLIYLHERGVVHRDIKLENILLASKGPIKDFILADFGLAIDHNESSMKSRCGSPGYIAPEILKKQKYSEKVDIYSAGVICFIL